jgi:excisionase family DNA binding protein
MHTPHHQTAPRTFFIWQTTEITPDNYQNLPPSNQNIYTNRMKVAKKTVWRHIDRGELKGFKFGRRGDWRVRESDLQIFLEESTRQPDEQD